MTEGSRRVMTLVLILAFAAGLRSWRLGQLSFWYDEVVTMRLAEAPTPTALIDRLFQIDATRAPLHPLLLQGWIHLFGATEAGARALSVACGVATVGLVWWIGRLAFDEPTGLWAVWLAALCPPMVYYSREARMYAWLVMLTCLCWGLLFSGRRASRLPGSLFRMAAYSLGLTALLYSHSLGLLMAGTLGLGSLLFLPEFFGTWRNWLGAHLGAAVLAGPWVWHYFDHPPEFLSGKLPLKSLLGTPIGFIGGNSLILLGLLGLVGLGILRRRGCLATQSEWSRPACLVLWLVLPPTLLYIYSLLKNPVFGPSRYTLYVAPAYLILVAQGLAGLPARARYSTAIVLALLAARDLDATVYAPGLKADWRAFSRSLAARTDGESPAEVTVLVASADPSRNVEVETARYYLPRGCRIIPLEQATASGLGSLAPGELYVAIGTKADKDSPLPSFLESRTEARFPGLTVYRVVEAGPGRRPEGRTPGASAGSGPD